MIKKPKLPRQGAKTAEDILLHAGASISWWEASEDILMGLFRSLCGDREPMAFETYVASPRGRRNEMMKSALSRYSNRFVADEIEKIRSAMKALDKLAEVRNQIAHGHCSEHSRTEDGLVTMSGFFLLPSLNEGFWHQRDFRYAHNVETMTEFIMDVREHRGIVMDISTALMMREQQARMVLNGEAQMTIDLAKDVVFGRIEPKDVTNHLKRLPR